MTTEAPEGQGEAGDDNVKSAENRSTKTFKKAWHFVQAGKTTKTPAGQDEVLNEHRPDIPTDCKDPNLYAGHIVGAVRVDAHCDLKAVEGTPVAKWCVGPVVHILGAYVR